MLIPLSVVRHFVEAGWYLGRAIELPPTYPEGHAATEILLEFCGLKIGERGAGIECAQSYVAFEPLGEPVEEILELEKVLQTQILGIGTADYLDLYADAQGHVFAFADVSGGVYFAGRSMFEAAERLLLGRYLMPLLLPSQASVGFYGQELYPADKRLFSLEDLGPTR